MIPFIDLNEFENISISIDGLYQIFRFYHIEYLNYYMNRQWNRYFLQGIIF
jgi:hypothetical protein